MNWNIINTKLDRNIKRKFRGGTISENFDNMTN